MYAPGEHLGAYRILEPLGRGAMGTVYVAEHSLIGRKVAIKVIASAVARHPEAMELFFREARAANQIAHPNIIQITDLVEASAEHPAFMVMELLDGFTLREVIDSIGALPHKRATEIGAKVASAMAAAHEARVIHRDLKPENIFLCNRTGDVKVLDFGIARLADSAAVEDLTCGTPLYISPEQAGADVVDARSDVYSLGAVLYEILSGRPVFDHAGVRQLLTAHIADPPPPLVLTGRGTERLVSLVMRCLEKDPLHRPQTMDSVAAELRSLLAYWRRPRESMTTAELEVRIEQLWDM